MYVLLFCEMLSSSIVLFPFFCFVFDLRSSCVVIFVFVVLANVAGRLSASPAPDYVCLRTAFTFISFGATKLVKILHILRLLIKKI